MIFPPAGDHAGTLHYIPPNCAAFEPARSTEQSSGKALHTLLWIGGMFDTFLTVEYPTKIAPSLPPSWRVMTASLGSAGKSWGVGSIAQDAKDMSKIISYIKQQQPSGKIVIMGHSTGCQDCMEYVVGMKSSERPAVDGVILQAPVSDREALEKDLPEAFMHEANQMALKMCREGHDKDAMPNKMTSPVFGNMAISARRWIDVASPAPDHSGADDYFSSDLPDDRLKSTFGKLPASTPLLILYSGDEESVPASLDKVALVSRWADITEKGGGQVDRRNGSIVLGATHNLNGCPENVVNDLVQRVVGFLGRLDSGDFEAKESTARM
jgi:pimeloyl-ACP methyl ester carboxylesterase